MFASPCDAINGVGMIQIITGRQGKAQQYDFLRDAGFLFTTIGEVML